MELDVASIAADVVRRPYVSLGMLAFVMLVPLAVTSNATMTGWLGRKNWQCLHRLVYVAAIAGTAHFIMVVKVLSTEPLVYAGLRGIGVSSAGAAGPAAISASHDIRWDSQAVIDHRF